MLDLRLPIGIFFLMIGLIIGVDGIFEPIKEPGVAIVLNRDWGFCLVVFGTLMTIFGVRGQKRQNAEAATKADVKTNSPANG